MSVVQTDTHDDSLSRLSTFATIILRTIGENDPLVLNSIRSLLLHLGKKKARGLRSGTVPSFSTILFSPLLWLYGTLN